MSVDKYENEQIIKREYINRLVAKAKRDIGRNWRDTLSRGQIDTILNKFKIQLNGMSVYELDKIIPSSVIFSSDDNEFQFDMSRGTGDDVKEHESWKGEGGFDPLSPRNIGRPNHEFVYGDARVDKWDPIPAGKLGLQKEHLYYDTPNYGEDYRPHDHPKMTDQRTRTGPLGFGTERKLYERDGKYYTTLSFVKGGNKQNLNEEGQLVGPEYLFSGGKEREISYERYKKLQKKMKKRRLRNISRND
tara:strand:+ start:1446 stop:2183 length:738 start_codon:yes stop_codon:yes gene_type:complete